jgi:hypothetical protein
MTDRMVGTVQGVVANFRIAADLIKDFMAWCLVKHRDSFTINYG